MSPRWPRWHPVPPSPRILQLPRRNRKTRHQKPLTIIRFAGKPPHEGGESVEFPRGKLGTLFDRERAFSRTAAVGLSHSRRDDEKGQNHGRDEGASSSSFMVAEDGWRFQVEMLRAECNLLRMEREVAEKKLEKTRSEKESWLRIVIDTLNSGKDESMEESSVKLATMALKKKVTVLEEQIQELERDYERRMLCNFDRDASLLQGRPYELHMDGDREGEEGDDDEEEVVRAMADVSISESEQRFRSMDGREYSAVENACSEVCRATIRRIVAHVEAETEQWTLIQRMLHQVKEEMEDLQESRDLWRSCALESNRELQSLKSEAEEWKRRALHAEGVMAEMQKHVIRLQSDVGTALQEPSLPRSHDCSLIPELQIDKENATMGKRMLVCRSMEKSKHRSSKQGRQPHESRVKAVKEACPQRPPLVEVGNQGSLRYRNAHHEVVLEIA